MHFYKITLVEIKRPFRRIKWSDQVNGCAINTPREGIQKEQAWDRVGQMVFSLGHAEYELIV